MPNATTSYVYCIVLSHSHIRKGQHNQQAGKLKREISPKYPQDKQKVESFTEEMYLTFAEETLLTLLNVHAGLAFWAPQSKIWAEKRKKEGIKTIQNKNLWICKGEKNSIELVECAIKDTGWYD